MQCNKCKATWTYGPSDVCPICNGKVTEDPAEAKPPNASPPLSQTKAWWEMR